MRWVQLPSLNCFEIYNDLDDWEYLEICLSATTEMPKWPQNYPPPKLKCRSVGPRSQLQDTMLNAELLNIIHISGILTWLNSVQSYLWICDTFERITVIPYFAKDPLLLNALLIITLKWQCSSTNWIEINYVREVPILWVNKQSS